MDKELILMLELKDDVRQKEKIIYNIIFLKINISYNNIFVTITDFKGNVLFKKSSGMLHFKGSKKKNPYVAGEVVKSILLSLKQKTSLIYKSVIVQILSHIKLSEIYNVLKEVESFYKEDSLLLLEKYKKKIEKKKLKKSFIFHKKNPKLSRLAYIEYKRLIAHNGVRAQKQRRI
jgi:ribosomal protein S11